MRLILVTPPAVEPLTAAEAKSRLGIGAEMADAAMESFVKAARQTIDGQDGWLGRALNTQKWKLLLAGFPCEPIRIPLPPLISVDSVKYYDGTGALQTVDPVDYREIGGARPELVAVTSWPGTAQRDDAVEITFTAGYGPDGSDVPEPIRSAIALMVSHLRSMSERNLFVSQEAEDGIGSTNYVVGGNAGAAIDAAVKALLSTYRVFS
ncbi:MAG: hypothetical protein M9932_04175 [Xanthobacteraceae bacterium]|nr:hypothetical protein [Xanthobacteraceae bacterium]